MRTGGVPVRQVQAEGCRLTGGYHLSEDQIAVSTLRGFRGRTSHVSELVRGRGVFRGPIFKRIYVEDPALGEPYVSARDLVMADVRPTSFLSRRLGGLLDELRLEEGMILITCSGMNLGSAIWTRRDLHGLVASHDLIRVCPDPDQIPPGYLHAFLASRYGRARIRKEIYGGNIKHIEPQHLAGIRVPRIPDSVEEEVHDLVLSAARLREEAARALAAAAMSFRAVDQLPALAEPASSTPFSVMVIPSSTLRGRLDAFFHSEYHARATRELAAGPLPTQTVASLATSIIEPVRFKRNPVPPGVGTIPFYGTSALVSIEPRALYSLSRRADIDQYTVDNRTLLLPRSGQLSGIIGRAVLPYGGILTGAVSEDAIRVRCKDVESAGFLYVALLSAYGERQLKARAYGSSIPHLDVHQIGGVEVPFPGEAGVRRIGVAGAQVAALRHQAVLKDLAARSLVEQAIEAAT